MSAVVTILSRDTVRDTCLREQGTRVWPLRVELLQDRSQILSSHRGYRTGLPAGVRELESAGRIRAMAARRPTAVD